VKTERLDSYEEIRIKNWRKALLKIDVQGFELQVLHGAGGSLKLFDAVYVECSFIELYEGQALADAVESYLRIHGFQLAAMENVILQGVKPIQADLMFLRIIEE